MHDSSESKSLSLVVTAFDCGLDLRFLTRAMSDPEDSGMLSSEIWTFPLVFHFVFLFGLRTGQDEVEWSSIMLVTDCERFGSLRVTLRLVPERN